MNLANKPSGSDLWAELLMAKATSLLVCIGYLFPQHASQLLRYSSMVSWDKVPGEGEAQGCAAAMVLGIYLDSNHCRDHGESCARLTALGVLVIMIGLEQSSANSCYAGKASIPLWQL